MNIGDWLARREMLTPNRVALIDASNQYRQITYHDWNRSANQVANFLHLGLGIQKRDRVAVLSKNSVGYLDMWFGLSKLGGILQNLNWRLSAREILQLIHDAEPIALFFSSDFVEIVDEIRPQIAGKTRVIAMDQGGLSNDLSFLERHSYKDDPPEGIELDWNDPWVICYTGGTTGIPKGAVLTYRSITANAVNTIVSWGLDQNDVTILNSPLFHSGGLNVFTAPLVYMGGTSIVCSDFDIEQTFDLLCNGKTTIWFGVPTMFIMMQNHPLWENADFKHLKLLISGGAPCPLPVFERFWEKGVDFKTGYGLTEAGPNTFWLPPEDVQKKPGSVGFPLFNIDVKVIREDGNECVPDEVGELVIQGPHVCQGYWNNPEATRTAIHPLPNEPGGSEWLFTGDLARRDADGYYYIVGRLKDMFISGGENVYPAEIESVLHGHPAVVEAAVIPISHETWGEVGCAIVVIRAGVVLQEDELLEYMRQHLARYKIPKSIVFVEQLPKTGANKVDKKLLESIYAT